MSDEYFICMTNQEWHLARYPDKGKPVWAVSVTAAQRFSQATARMVVARLRDENHINSFDEVEVLKCIKTPK